ncbi:GntR family transcriptional regulator [Streptomyces sp. NPDC001904]|uniref:GntR family transcriptional regulator n=1 Tax=Streptomyces sp. NPDC001904 TaxID=3154531 RepID=UPI003329E808
MAMPSNSGSRSAAETAYQHVKQAIISGRLPGGQLVTESEISEALGISRTPAHEAFLRLSGERLLDLAGRRGAVVTPIAPREAQDVLEMRQVLEGEAARRVVAEGGPSADLVRTLTECVERQRVHLDAANLEAFVAVDETFHSAVVRASGNAIAEHFFTLLRDRQQRLRHQLLTTQPQHLPKVVDDHQELLGRLSAGDAAGYVAVLADHVARHQGAM